MLLWTFRCTYTFELVFLFCFVLFLDICPGVEFLGHRVVLFLEDFLLVFLGSISIFGFYCFPQWLHQFTFLPKVCVCVPFFSMYSTTFVICDLSGDGHSDTCEVISHCDFDFHLPNDSNVEHLFMCLLVIYVPSWKNVYSGFCPFFGSGFFFKFSFYVCAWGIWMFPG